MFVLGIVFQFTCSYRYDQEVTVQYAVDLKLRFPSFCTQQNTICLMTHQIVDFC
jgi:hypothetical protein